MFIPVVFLLMLPSTGGSLRSSMVCASLTRAGSIMQSTPFFFWCTFWYIDLFAGIVVLSAFPDYVPGAAALPAYALTVLFAVPPLFCFLALFNFVFWCRSNVEDVVGQTYCNLIQLLVFYPSLLISAIPVVRDSPLAKVHGSAARTTA